MRSSTGVQGRGRKAPRRDGQRWALGITLVVLALIGLGIVGLARWSATRTFKQFDTISFTKSCGGVDDSYFEGQILGISTENAIVTYANEEGRTVGEELRPGSEVYVDGTCGRYAVAVVESVNYVEEGKGISTVKIRAYYFQPKSNAHNPIQVGPAPTEKYGSMETYTLNPGDTMTVLVRGDNTNHDYVLRWDGRNMRADDGACVDDHVNNMYICDSFVLVSIAQITPDGKLIGFTPNYDVMVFRP